MGAPNFEQLPQQVQMPLRDFQKTVKDLPKQEARQTIEYLEQTSGTKSFFHDSIGLLFDYPAQMGSLLLFAGLGALVVFRKKIKEFVKNYLDIKAT